MGAAATADTEDAWCQRLRRQWRPERVKLLLVGESAPDAGAGTGTAAGAVQRRFFYAPTVNRADNLFRGVVLALYGEKVSAGDDRAPLLRRLLNDGVWLVDLVPFPVNHLSPSARSRALLKHAPARTQQILDIAPDGIIICHVPTFRALAPALVEAGATLLHREPIPFPLGNFRAQFAAAVREAIA